MSLRAVAASGEAGLMFVWGSDLDLLPALLRWLAAGSENYGRFSGVHNAGAKKAPGGLPGASFYAAVSTRPVSLRHRVVGFLRELYVSVKTETVELLYVVVPVGTVEVLPVCYERSVGGNDVILDGEL